MTTYYPLTNIPTSSSCAGYTAPVLPPTYRAQPVSHRSPNDALTDLIGVQEDWLPRWDRLNRPDTDPAQAMLGEKADLAKMTVGAIVYEIIQRQQLKEENLTRILYQEVAVDSRIVQFESAWAPYSVPPDSRTKTSLEAELIRLEQQKRAEEVECWRDISRLKERLLETLGMYRDSARRERMVTAGMVHAGGR